MEINVYVEKCREDIELPTYANKWDAGMDIRSAVDVLIYPKQTLVIPTGLKFSIPIFYEIQVRPRSGLSLKTPLRIANSVGTIDSGYRDEVGIIITNTSETHWHWSSEAVEENDTLYYLTEKDNRNGIYHIKKGDRIAQIVLKQVPIIKWVETDDINKYGINRKGGFGSTGIT